MTALGALILYTKRMDDMIAFYTRHFGFSVQREEGDRIVELRPPPGGVPLLLHPAAAGQRAGQAQTKLVFAVEDVQAFCEAARSQGLEFGSIHAAAGYQFANAKDPSGNSVSVSSRPGLAGLPPG